MRRAYRSSISLFVAMLAACSEPGPPEPIVEPPPAIPNPPPVPPPPPPDPITPPPPPPYQLPDVWGASAVADADPDPNIVEIDLVAAPLQVTVVDDITIDAYAFNGTIPGPVINVKVGDELIVHFRNDLPEPTTIHWHGLRIPADMDGSPRIQTPVQPGETFTYRFVVPEAGSFWYHPHVRANEQIEKGLYGPLVVHDEKDPVMDVERYLMLDDILLSSTGLPPFLSSGHEMVHGRSGNLLLTNGTANELVESSEVGRVERWRIVNTANARTMEVSVDGPAEWKIVGTDGGRIVEQYTAERIVVTVGQRYDLEVRYVGTGTVALNSHVLVLDENNNVVERAIPVFEVNVTATDREPTAIQWLDLEPREPRTAGEEVTMTFDTMQDRSGRLMWTINGVAHGEHPIFNFNKGATVLMHLRNNAGPEHPFHLHGQFFEILSGGQPDPAQPGLKDVVLVPGLETVDILAYFDNSGRWMAHCHILEHAELGMMAEITVDDQ